MKIAHLSTPLSWRGGEQQIAYLIEQLGEKSEVKQILICPKDSEMSKKNWVTDCVVYPIKKRSGMDLRFVAQLAKILKKENVDLLHLHDAHAHTFGVLAATFFGVKIPMVLSRRVDFAVGKSWTSRYKYNHSCIHRILCVSNAIANIVKDGINNKGIVHTVYSGIDLSRFEQNIPTDLKKELTLPKEATLIGNVAALADHKDYFTFIKTAEILIEQHSQLHFCIVGDGPMATEIKDFAAKSKAKKNIHFLGFRTDVIGLLKALDIFLFTSKTEGLGTSILDALASGTPVVATQAGGIPEIIEDGKTGLLAPVQQPHTLAEKVVQLLADEPFKKQLIVGGNAKVQLFSVEYTAEQTYGHYLAVLNG